MKMFLVALVAALSVGVASPAEASPRGDRSPGVGQKVPLYAPPCLAEDGAYQYACVWDAKRRGNGLGHSFVKVNEGRFVYVSHRKAKRMVKRWRKANCVRITKRDWACYGENAWAMV